MDITFAYTPDGRPELYDFFWEHLPRLVHALNEKKVRLQLTPPAEYSKWAKMAGMKSAELEHSIQKLMEDKRIGVNSQHCTHPFSSVLELQVSVDQLDHVLNAHNVFLERMLPYLKLEGKNMAVDFSPAEKNAVQCFSTSQYKPFINTFLVRNLARAPRVRSIVFASAAERARRS